MSELTKTMEVYFKTINDEVLNCYDIANKAKSMGFDPNKSVKIPLAKNIY